MAFERQKIDAAQLPPTITAKWAPDILDEGFVPFPKRLLRCMASLFGGKNGIELLAVVLCVADYRRPQLQRPPSRARLAFTANMPETLFQERLRELKNRGWVEYHGSPALLEVEIDGLIKEIKQQTRDED